MEGFPRPGIVAVLARRLSRDAWRALTSEDWRRGLDVRPRKDSCDIMCRAAMLSSGLELPADRRHGGTDEGAAVTTRARIATDAS